MLLVGRDGTIIDAVGDAPTLTGFPVRELIGRSAVEVLQRAGIVTALPEPGVAQPVRIDGHLIETWLDRASLRGPVDQIVVLQDVTPSARGITAGSLVIADAMLLEQLPGATWTTDRELRITGALGQLQRSLGLPAERIVGMNVSDIARTREPSDPAIVAHHAALGGERSTFRYQLRERWYDVTVTPLRDDSGAIIGCMGTAVDVTKRAAWEKCATAHEAELVRSLRGTISVLEATLESTADGILVIDRAGKVAAYNKRFAALWRIPAPIVDARDDSALLSFVLDQLVDPDGFMRGVHSLYKHPRAESLDMVLFKDGRVFERYSRPQYVGDDIVGRVWSFRDVTERERVVRRLRLLAEASRLLTTVDVEDALGGVARLVVQDVGAACTIEIVIDGQPRRVAAATSGAERISAPPPFAIREDTTVLRETAGRVEATVPMLSRGNALGALRVIAHSGRGFTGQDVEALDEVARRCATAVQAERLREQRADEVRAREEFLAVAAHEFRSPLTVISLAAAALRGDIGDRRHLIGEIEREGGRMTMLVQELLDAAKLRIGELRLDLETVDLVAETRAVLRELDYELASSGSKLTLNAPPELLGRWDRMRIHQVLANVVSNAIKYGDGRPIELTLDASRDRATVSVTDHGIGILASDVDTLFEPFVRATPARRYGGLGLGLFIVRRIVEALGGEIDVRSDVGMGSTFTVTLPREGQHD